MAHPDVLEVRGLYRIERMKGGNVSLTVKGGDGAVTINRDDARLIADALDSAVNHPAHPHVRQTAQGVFEPVIPDRATSARIRWRTERACRRRGGHWWHPTDAMIGWACCQCGKPTDGMPKDGSGR